ncbi:MAG: DUF4157 domain-containing protein, partial [Mycetocola sp.]
METSFGTNFESVRVHTTAAPSVAARDRHLWAFTLGNDVTFAPGRYAPASEAGRRLLIHELAHVVQQRQSGQRASASGLEHQADRAVREVSGAGAVLTPLSAAPAAAQHSPEGKQPENDQEGSSFASKPAVDIPIRKLPFVPLFPWKTRLANFEV